MKPDWKDAPEWAQWLAMDSDGSWFWFESEPKPDDAVWRRKKGAMQALLTSKNGAKPLKVARSESWNHGWLSSASSSSA